MKGVTQIISENSHACESAVPALQPAERVFGSRFSTGGGAAMGRSRGWSGWLWRSRRCRCDSRHGALHLLFLRAAVLYRNSWLRPRLAHFARGECSETAAYSIARAAFCTVSNASLPRKPIFSSRRRVSTTRICEMFAFAGLPSTTPTARRSACSRGEVINGTTIHASGPREV